MQEVVEAQQGVEFNLASSCLANIQQSPRSSKGDQPSIWFHLIPTKPAVGGCNWITRLIFQRLTFKSNRLWNHLTWRGMVEELWWTNHHGHFKTYVDSPWTRLPYWHSLPDNIRISDRPSDVGSVFWMVPLACCFFVLPHQSLSKSGPLEYQSPCGDHDGSFFSIPVRPHAESSSERSWWL